MAITTSFDGEKHEYWADGALIPSVTQVLALAGISDTSGIPPHILEIARRRGSDVHQACQFLDEGDLDFATVPEECASYVLAYEQFKRDTGFYPVLIEQTTSHELGGLRYGLTIDRVGTIGDRRVLLDLKCTHAKERHWQIQTAAYACAFNLDARGVLWLKKDESYELIWHEDIGDFDVFQAALKVAWWKWLPIQRKAAKRRAAASAAAAVGDMVNEEMPF